MKKLIVTIAALLAAAALFQAGRREGIRHAIEDSIIFTVECYDPENPYENSREDGTDQTIYIDLDGDLYEHGMYQG
jgi:hypothetical protein